jgi:U3 small nucleolar RNA-associated protein 20
MFDLFLRRVNRGLLHGRIVQRRLTSILKAFASVSGPKQLFKHGVLLSIFISLLSQQETTIAQHALTCVLKYKLPFVTPYAERLEALFSKGGLKESLLKFTTSFETTEMDSKQKQCLLPILMRILFGRVSARAGSCRSSKDSPAARRSAVLSFVSTMCETESELYPFIYLMVRNYIPPGLIPKPVEEQDIEARHEILEKVKGVSVTDMECLPSQVHIGFLHLLEAVIANFGHRATAFVDPIISIILAMCKMAEIKQVSPSEPEDSDDDDSVEPKQSEGKSQGMGSIRTLCFRRLSEIFAQFAHTISFTAYTRPLWNSIRCSVNMLPETVVNCKRVPALLSMLHTLSSHPRLIPLLLGSEETVPSVIKCLADTSSHAVVDCVLDFIANLLGDDSVGSAKNGLLTIISQVDLILHQFMIRLGKKSIPVSNEGSLPATGEKEANKPQMRALTWRRELVILSRISELIENDKGMSTDDLAEKLCTLLIPFLQQEKGTTETDQLNVLTILDALMSKVGLQPCMVYYEHFAQLLGPSKAKPGIVSIPVRQAIASVVNKIGQNGNTSVANISGILGQLCKPHSNRVDEMDFDAVIPALNSLGNTEDDSDWLSLSKTVDNDSEYDTKLLSPLVFTCFHFLFNEDGVVSRGAFRALKSLIQVASVQAGFSSEGSQAGLSDNTWVALLERCIVPAVRAGLNARNSTIRRLYILLIAEVARRCKDSSMPNLYGDLSALIRDDEEDLDFFFNITHVQIHRRTRAFQRLRKLLSHASGGHSDSLFTLQSLSNVLLPMAVHPVYESKTKAEETFALEAIATVGAISRHLSWSKYNNFLWTNLTQFHRHEDQERYLVAMICAIIDGFHFDVSMRSDAAESEGVVVDQTKASGSAVWRALEKRFIPKIEGLLVKEKVDRNGSKTKTLRASVVLALVKLFKKFSKEIFESRLPRLLTVICAGLKDRDSDARDVARSTLAKVAVEIEIDYLPDILRELAIALNEGFRLHVRIATVHSILLELSENYKPQGGCSDEEALHLTFDRSVPALMDLIQQDLFGAAQERRDAEGAHVRFVKEAAGSKSLNAIEIIGSLIVFRPSLGKGTGVVPGPSSLSGIHALVSPLIERLRLPDVETTTIRRVKESLSRVVTGLSRNPTITLEEVLPFVYATAAPFIGLKDVSALFTSEDDDESSDEEPVKPIHVSGKSKSSSVTSMSPTGKGIVADWRPSAIKSTKTSKAASAVKHQEARKLRKVQDGAAAPKLTGSYRHTSSVLAAANRINEPANIGAVVFSLRLLYAVLKKNRPAASSAELVPLADPFVPLLTACVCASRETDVVLLSLRSLGLFLSLDLPSKNACAAALGSKTLDLLSSAGVGSNQNSDLSQACFKMLTLLMNTDRAQSKSEIKISGGSAIASEEEQVLAKNSVMPLDSEQMKVLISFLQESVVDVDNHNAALNLIKAVMTRRFLSPEFYDLMETLVELSVRSQKASLRQVSCYG